LINQISSYNIITARVLNHYHNAPITLYNKNMHYTKPPEVDRAWPAYIRRRGPYFVHLVFSNEKACYGLDHGHW